MSSKQQSAKFFCENCGAEVPQDAKVCKHCGKFFSSVRCPVCGETGTPGKFSNGCPKCGYAVGKGKKINSPKQKESHASRKSKKELLNAIDSRNSNTFAKKRISDGHLPVWSYFALFLILIMFVFCTARYLGM
ncbi:zinc ribbon domain-containing protein [Treponema sp.]|uniref:zinc ribbon domain-containing protein n=1 Tax=Treponema sp. TaxID=166 RepID=UPI00388FB13A